jgi:hypothetical protein
MTFVIVDNLIVMVRETLVTEPARFVPDVRDVRLMCSGAGKNYAARFIPRLGFIGSLWLPGSQKLWLHQSS